MDPDNLKTASLYINNQLLSRGLLRNGQNIHFARPDKDEGGISATMGRVMSVINDLILRRDRDATQRENLSQTIRALRADSLRQTTEIERLGGKYEEAQRKVHISDAAERALKQQLKTAEQAARGLKEEMGRMRMLVGQTRAQCGNDVRKREKVIEGLKKHVSDWSRARGSGKAVGVAVITVTPGVGKEDITSGATGVDDTAYDLRRETNDFLTELARGLSEDNEQLGSLVRKTVETLKTLSGCEKDGQGQDVGMVHQMDHAYETLASEMDFVIEHLRNLLTNPSFVPIEEVEVREEEIIRLRDGWERMESRWKDAVEMMEGWRKRLARSGQTVNLEELKMGLMLSPLKVKDDGEGEGLKLSMVMEDDEGLMSAESDAVAALDIMPMDELGDEISDSYQSSFDDDPIDEVPGGSSEEQQIQDITLNTVSSGSPGPPPQLSPLKETTGNRGSPVEPRSKAFTTILEENTWDLLQLEASSPSKAREVSPPRRDRASKPETQKPHQASLANASDEILLTHAPSPIVARSQSGSCSPPRSPTPKTSSTNLHLDSRVTQATVPSSARSRSRSRSPRSKKSSSNLNAEAKPRASTTPWIDSHTTPKFLPPSTTLPPQNDEAEGNERQHERAQVDLGLASRLPRLRNDPPPAQQSPLTMATIAAKLAATEREADAARVRAKLKAARSRTGSRAISAKVPPDERKLEKADHPETKSATIDESKPEMISKRKKMTGAGRRVSGRANRRRSTLSPWELESLMLGGVGSPEKA